MSQKKSISPKAAEIDTRSRLMEAGLDIFGEYGYTAATTRLIAGKGGVNLAAILYHFGGKEGLYRAVVAHITATVGARLAPVLEAVAARAAGEMETAESARLLEALLGKLIDFVVGSEEAPRFSRIILREQMYPSGAFATVYEGVMAPLVTAIATLLAAATGEGAPTRTVRLQAFALLGQVFAFRFGRETVVRALGLSGYSAAETAEIRGVLLDQVRATLAGLAAAGQDQKGERQ